MPRLDVESEDERRARLERLFGTLAGDGADAAEGHGDDGAAPAFPTPPPRPHAMPESDALARARAFLPLMKASNAEIAARQAAGEDVAIDKGIGGVPAPGRPAPTARAGGRDGPSGAGGDHEEGAQDGENDDDEEDDEDDEADDEEDEEDDGDGAVVSVAAAPAIEMDVGLGVFDVRGDATGDMGPVVERDASVWAQHAPAERAPLVAEHDAEETMDEDDAPTVDEKGR